MPNVIYFSLVEGDDMPIPVRFEGIVLADYDPVTLNMVFADDSTDTFSVESDNADRELGFVQMDVGGFSIGRHYGEFEFTNAQGKIGTLPKDTTIIFNVRAELG